MAWHIGEVRGTPLPLCAHIFEPRRTTPTRRYAAYDGSYMIQYYTVGLQYSTVSCSCRRRQHTDVWEWCDVAQRCAHTKEVGCLSPHRYAMPSRYGRCRQCRFKRKRYDVSHFRKCQK